MSNVSLHMPASRRLNVRHCFGLIACLALLGAACGSDEPVVSSGASADGVIVTFELPGGECDVCDFVLELRDDGTATYTGFDDASVDLSFDLDAALLAIDDLQGPDRRTSPTDCGREVDGNAPIITAGEFVIDLCTEELDPKAPILALLEGLRAEGEAAHARTTTTTTSTPTPPESEGPGRRLAIVTDEGGLCQRGVCVSTVDLAVDGTWIATGDDGQTRTGTVDVSELAALVTTTEQDDVVTGPFTGECPTAFDGVERHYFVLDAADEPVVSILTCRDAIDESHPLIAELDRLVDVVRAAPGD